MFCLDTPALATAQGPTRPTQRWPKRVAQWATSVGCAMALLACGGGVENAPSSVAQSTVNIQGNSTPGDNVVDIVVDAGPGTQALQVNRLYTSVTLCQPGTSNCKTIDHVLLDTGSTGLRLLASVVPASLNLPGVRSAPLYGCQQYLDGSFSWGALALADVRLGQKTAAQLPVQLITTPTTAHNSRTNCLGSGAITGVESLGANGILGVGINPEDCGAACTRNAYAGYYYQCTDRCVGTTVPLAQQLQNPVPHFAGDNNGFAIVFPKIDLESATSIQGSMVLGIGTQANNLPAANTTTLQSANGSGYITTTLANGSTKTSSFLDTGSNGLFFDSTTVGSCAAPLSDFYCPASRTRYSATLTGKNGARATVDFVLDNTNTVLNVNRHVYPGLGGAIRNSTIFDWGLPFFYGRTVWIGLENTNSSLGTGPYYAF